MKNLILLLALAVTLGASVLYAPIPTASASENATAFMPVIGADNEVTLLGVKKGQVTLRTNSMEVVEIYGRSVIRTVFSYRADKEQKDLHGIEVLIDPYRREYCTGFTNNRWMPITEYKGAPEDDKNYVYDGNFKISRGDFDDAVYAALTYLEKNRPVLIVQACEPNSKEAQRLAAEKKEREERAATTRRQREEREAAERRQREEREAAERAARFERIAAPIIARVQEKYTPDFVSTFHWEQFSTESVNYSKVPKLSELLGHVFLLTDSYGMRLAYDTHSSEDGDVGRLLTRETAKSGLVHFAVLNEYDENIVALMDDTGAFQGSDYQSKPIAVRFSSYSHETNKYGWGKPNNIISTNGYVLGDANMGENFNYLTTGSVSLSIEKTDRPGIYHLVYYVTTMADIKKGQQMRRVGNYYATLELVK
ncbi:hypothetical protein HMPREF9081_1501 [Centipeda periodontii DSM 2778]|uniref:Uncharacterized protein n=1 Tax=Centipeda periodontii DSM 2778 TaxID=888060 RepID=F5RML5_9FIRM|nr:hypothetical protein [Centipeda periodontii]EGK59513.1 hypothetical protein HMPREF9081_1501 [Centipeda periodontii DSM 2778]